MTMKTLSHTNLSVRELRDVRPPFLMQPASCKDSLRALATCPTISLALSYSSRLCLPGGIGGSLWDGH
jgi:hypothetical protein